MPIIRVQMLAGRSAEQKERLAAALTEAMVTEAGARREGVMVLMEDVAADAWAIGGKLVRPHPKPTDPA